MLFDQTLTQLLVGRDLSEAQSNRVFRQLFEEKLQKDEAKALLLLLARKGETGAEVLGCLKAIRALEPTYRVPIPSLMDTCGTGGDQSHSFNISTVSALVIAGAGGKVAKHGNRALSSKSGSSDLMETLGVKLNAPRHRMIQAIRRYGIGYFHAPFYHPVFSRVQPLRRELGVRTIFNLLGPLLNPLPIKAQLIGVAKPEYVPLFATLLRKIGVRHALVCHSQDGMDEISTAAPTTMAQVKRNGIIVKRMEPKRFGFQRATKRDFRGGSAKENSRVTLKLLQGKWKGPLRDIVTLNAAAGLVVSGLASNIEQGIRLAGKSIDSQAAYQALLGLKRLSRKQ